jgi:hypothetical protein
MVLKDKLCHTHLHMVLKDKLCHTHLHMVLKDKLCHTHLHMVLKDNFWSMVYDTDSTVVVMLGYVDVVCICLFTCISFMAMLFNQKR